MADLSELPSTLSIDMTKIILRGLVDFMLQREWMSPTGNLVEDFYVFIAEIWGSTEVLFNGGASLYRAQFII